MEALRLHRTVERDGGIHLTDLPCKKGQRVEMIVFIEVPEIRLRPFLTARQLLNSGLIGLWKDRTDIGDSTAYARYLREQAQRRVRG